MSFTRLTFIAFAILTLISGAALINAKSSQAQAAPNVSAETVPDDSLARNAHTPREDIALTNSCIEAGQDKTHCLCVIRIFKHDMTTREYRAAVALYDAEFDVEPTSRTAARISLAKAGYGDDEVTAIDKLRRELTQEPGFADRCSAATRYFSAAIE